MTTAASRLRVLLVLPGARGDADPAFAAIFAAAVSHVHVERLGEPTENGLRERLTRGDVDVVHFVVRGKVKATAGYAVVELDASAGGTRAVNVRHLAGVLAQERTLQLVVVQPSSPTEQLAGVENVLRDHGVPAALVTAAMPLRAGTFAAALYGALAGGATLAQACTAAKNALAGEPAQAAALHLAASQPEQVPKAFAAEAAGAATAAAPAAPPRASVAAPATVVVEESPLVLRERELQRVLAAKRSAGRFDVFMCHNHVDKPAVKVIANALKSRGLLPWLDQWELPPGQPWQPLLERQIGNIAAAAVCVGSAGVGPWQTQELYGFLSEFVARRAPVIPVLLPGATSRPELPIFLRLMTYVDFGLSDPEPMAQLEWGITGIRPEAV